MMSARKAYSGTLTRCEIVRANASLGELRRDKEKLSLPISYEFVRVTLKIASGPAGSTRLL